MGSAILVFTKSAVANSRKHQTLNTPALATLLLMNNQIDWLIKQGGLDWAQEHCNPFCFRVVSMGWRPAITLLHLCWNEGARSTVVVTIDIDEELSASEITRALRANGIVDVSGYRGLGRNQLRIGVFPICGYG